jgi:hypothetical protein
MLTYFFSHIRSFGLVGFRGSVVPWFRGPLVADLRVPFVPDSYSTLFRFRLGSSLACCFVRFPGLVSRVPWLVSVVSDFWFRGFWSLTRLVPGSRILLIFLVVYYTSFRSFGSFRWLVCAEFALCSDLAVDFS